MVNMTAFNKVSVKKNTPIATPTATKVKPTKNNNSLAAKANEAFDRDGAKPDDPLRILNVAFGDALDRFEKQIASYGPDTGQRAAESAATVMRQNASRLSSQIKGATLAVVFVGAGLMLGAGMLAGWTLRGSIDVEVAGLPGETLPREMAEKFSYQNWHAQWAARQPVNAGRGDSGIRWVLVPFVETPPRPPKEKQ